MTASQYAAYQARRDAARQIQPQKAESEPQEAGIEPGEPFTRSSERVFHYQILGWLRMKGVLAVVHSRMDRASTQERGVADFLYVVAGVPVAMEVKVGKGKLTPAQVGWLEAARADGWTVGVVRTLDDVIALFKAAKAKHPLTAKTG